MAVWVAKIDLSGVFNHEALSFEQRRDAIVKRLQRSHWVKGKDEFDDLPQLLEELSETEDVEAFDEVWSSIYDEADADRIWIVT